MVIIMNALFIITESSKQLGRKKPLNTQEDIHLGISYISSMLERHGHHTDLLVLTPKTKFSVIDRKIGDFKPSIILTSIVYKEFFTIIRFVQHIKSLYPDIYLVAGGTHVTLNAADVLCRGYDAVCIAEGEFPTLELVQQLERGERPSHISNMWFNTPNGIEKNDVRSYIEKLDELPFPNRKMWQPFIQTVDSMHDIIIGRGCPYNCTYCCNHALREKGKGCYVRFRKPEGIVAEISDLLKQFPKVNTIFLEAEAINLNMEFLEQLAQKLQNLNASLPSPLAFGANIRLHFNIDIKHIMDLFVKANIIITNIGIESGSERVRRDILKRGEYSNCDIRRAVYLAKKAHRHLMLFVLLGIPGETLEESRETLTLVRECRPSFIHLGIFTPYPGTELYNVCEREKLIDTNQYREKGRNKATFDTQFMTKRQIQKEYNRFFPAVYAKNASEYIYLRIMSYLILRHNLYFLSPFVIKYLK